MTPVAWRVVGLVALLLASPDREAVVGDLAEAKAGFTAALLSIAGLFIRRQLGLWRNWQPWLALVGVSGIAASFLSFAVFRFELALSQQLETYRTYGVHYEMGVSATQDIIALACIFTAIVFWSWTSGFVLGSLSGRSAWLTGIFFYLVVCTAWFVHHRVYDQIRYGAGAHQAPLSLLIMLLIAPFSPAKLAVLLFATWGSVTGIRKHVLSSSQILALTATGTLIVVLLLWTGSWYESAKLGLSNGTWHPDPWTRRALPFLVMSWPFAYAALSGFGLRFKEKHQH